MDITVTVSIHDDWEKHSYTRGKPDMVDITHARGTNSLHIVLSPNIRLMLEGATNEAERLVKIDDIRSQVDFSIGFVSWIEDK